MILVVPRNSKLRDEFTCPITRELFNDPVIASDGHTYCRSAIEQWILCMQSKRLKPTSPKTGEELCHLHLIPNHNLKRLLRDMLIEGRADALYCKVEDLNEEDVDEGEQDKERSESISSTPLTALVREKVLHLTCLGPADSELNNRSFHVTESEGCIGGRRRPQEIDAEQHKNMNYIQFTEVTISRRHFKIMFDSKSQYFCVQDLGSAGGTYIRMEAGKGLPIRIGTMFMVGKHQLIAVRAPSTPNNQNNLTNNNRTSITDSMFRKAQFDDSESQTNYNIPPKTDKGLKKELSNSDCMSILTKKGEFIPNDNKSILSEPDEYNSSKNGDEISIESNDDMQNRTECDFISGIPDLSSSLSNNEIGSKSKFCDVNKPELVLRCFAPEGTPIQNMEYLIDESIGTLGRKQTNTISFSHEVNGAQVGIDSSVSSEHAVVKYSNNKSMFELFDGNRECKGSTNGTWIRLSKMHEESAFFRLKHDTEILFGTIRFKVQIDEQVVEREISSTSKANLS